MLSFRNGASCAKSTRLASTRPVALPPAPSCSIACRATAPVTVIVASPVSCGIAAKNRYPRCMPVRNGAGKGRAIGVLKRDLPVGDGQLIAQQRRCEAGRVGGRGKEIGDVQLAVGTALDLHLGHVQ